MRDLGGIHCDLVKPQQQCQALQPRILPYGFQSRPRHHFRSSSLVSHVCFREAKNNLAEVVGKLLEIVIGEALAHSGTIPRSLAAASGLGRRRPEM